MTILTASELSSLDKILSRWEFGEYTSEAIVILGCVGEFIAEFTDCLTGGDEVNKKRLSKLSLLILIAGLAAGLTCLMGATVTSGRLIASLNEEAGQARKDAGDAIERASKADERSKRLEGDNLVLQAEVLKLQAAATWRDFTKAQHDKLVSLAKLQRVGRTPALTLTIDSVVGNPEAKRYGGQLASALSDALGLPQRVDNPLGLSTCLECTGVWVCVNETASPAISTEAKSIREMLALSGVKGAKFCTDPKNGQGAATAIKIIVGPKE